MKMHGISTKHTYNLNVCKTFTNEERNVAIYTCL